MAEQSPGHCAKFGTYTFMDLTTTKICSVQLVQNNVVGNSSRMEKEGFQNEGLQIAELVTDRPQILKFMQNTKDTKHTIDIWLVAKGTCWQHYTSMKIPKKQEVNKAAVQPCEQKIQERFNRTGTRGKANVL